MFGKNSYEYKHFFASVSTKCRLVKTILLLIVTNHIKGVGEGGAGGGARASPLSKVGGTSGFVPPPPLLGRANVLVSLFAHILWLKTHFFFQNFLGSLRSPTLINQYFLNFAQLNL